MTTKLPKGYLSWSQMSLWEKSPQKYIDQYINGKKPFESREMSFGKWFADAVERRGADDPITDQVVRMVNKRDWQESETDVVVQDIPLKAVFDTVDKQGFDEYKTGKVPWDIERVKNHGQLDFYAVVFRAKLDVIPEIALHWIPTANDEKEGLKLLGEVHSYCITKTKEELDAFEQRIVKVANEISNYKQFEKKVVKI